MVIAKLIFSNYHQNPHYYFSKLHPNSMRRKFLNLNYLQMQNWLLSMQSVGISSAQMILKLPSQLATMVQEKLESYLPSDSDSEDEDEQLNHGKYNKQISSNIREVVGIMMHQQRQLEDIEKDHNIKILCTARAIKIFSNNRDTLLSSEMDLHKKLLSKIRSVQIQRLGLELYNLESVVKRLHPIKIIKYSHDKYCYFYKTNDIDDDSAQKRMVIIQNQYQRQFVPFLSSRPFGEAARKALKAVIELKTRKLIQLKNDKNTEISMDRNGFIISANHSQLVKELKSEYWKQIHEECLTFICLVRRVPDIQEKLTKLKNIAKYLFVAFTDQQVRSASCQQQRLISMLIKVQDLDIILKQQKFRKVFRNFLNQIHQINENCVEIGFFFPFENQYYAVMKQKFEQQLHIECVFPKSNKHLSGIMMVVPKMYDNGSEYLGIFDAAVKRKLSLRRLKDQDATIYKEQKAQIQKSMSIMNQSEMNNATNIQDQSQYDEMNSTSVLKNIPINNTVLNTTVFNEYIQSATFDYTLNFNLQIPAFQQMNTPFKRQGRSTDIDKLMETHTGQLYKTWRISLKKDDEQYPTDLADQKNQVTCLLKLSEGNQTDYLYFQKITLGKKMDRGLLVQVILDTDLVQEKEDGFKLKKTKSGKMFVPTHEVQLI